jgi:hypothetical protein
MMSEFMNYDTLSTEVSDSSYDLLAEEERKKFVCKHPGCGKIFRYKSEIERHIATHSESRPFVCQYDNCFKAFKRSDALENHVRSSHTKETPFACPFPDCGMKFTTHGSFRYHVLKHNKQGIDLESLAPAQPKASQPRKQVKLNTPSENTVVFNQGPVKGDLAFNKMAQHSLGDNFLAPAPRFASKQLQWEVVNEESECSTPTHKSDDSEKLTQVVEENKFLKQKLVTSEKIIKSMQKQISDLLGSLFAYQNQAEMTRQNSSNYQEFSTPSDNYFQGNYLENQPKEEVPVFDMSNYEELNFLSAVEPKAELEANIDGFLSFGNSFDF